MSELVLPIGFPASFDEGSIDSRNDDSWPKIDSRIEVSGGKLTRPVIVRSGWSNKGLCQAFISNNFEPIKDSKGQDTRFELTATGAIENVKIRKASHVISVLRNMGNTQADSAMLADMGIEFTYPKPFNLIQYLVSMLDDKAATVLDFFAGSGTTAHAVAKLNAEDGGNRKFILVSSTEATEEQPDKNLCRDVCAERVRRVLGGYTNARGQAVAGLGGSFAYLRARRVPKHRMSQKLDHAEIWCALQLLHGRPLSPWPGGGFAVDEGDDHAIAYLADAYPASRTRMEAWLAARDTQAATVYSWAPERYRGVDSPHDWRPIPQHLRERFGR